MEIQIDNNTEQTIREALNQRIARTMRNVMPDIGEVILTSIEDRFDAQSSETPVFPLDTPAGPWNALEPGTLKNKKGGKILMGGQNAELRKQFSYKYDGESLHITNSRMVGTWSLFLIHQFGAEAGKGGVSKIPARPMLALQKEEIEEIINLIREGLSE